MTERSRKKKAELSQALLALLMYTAITPGRSKEYFTLQYKVTDSLPSPITNDPKAPNMFFVTELGDRAEIILSDHKTAKHYGWDHINLTQDSLLLSHAVQHIQMHRYLLCHDEDSRYLFLVSYLHSSRRSYLSPCLCDYINFTFTYIFAEQARSPLHKC